MNEYSRQQFDAFFTAILVWRPAYERARLHFFATGTGNDLSIVAARIYLDVGGDDQIKPLFRAGNLVVGQWEIPQASRSVEDVVRALVADEGLCLDGIGRLRLTSDPEHEVFVSPPTLLHAEGLNLGNRLAVLRLAGMPWAERVPQPESDWLLKAAAVPFDSIQELCLEHGLGRPQGDLALIEVVARNAVQVLARSEVKGTLANLGIWMARGLDTSRARLGYRVLNNGVVLLRGSISGADMNWQEDGPARVGTAEFVVPAGAVIQCIASYGEHAHHVQWRADPSVFQNPRLAVLSLIDPSQQTLRAFLQPDLPVRGRAADDFEAAISWLIWALGFSPAAFGTNSKTRDAFDIVAVSPRGDFVVIECTLGLLRAESKLSKLTARAASLRESLGASNLTNLRVLPVIITAMSTEQVKGDVAYAEELGVLVLTRDNMSQALETELLRFPDADSLYERAIAFVDEKKSIRGRPSVLPATLAGG